VSLFTEERLRTYPILVLGSLVAAIVILLATADGVRTLTGTLGGDYGAFYGAAELVATGRSSELYDWEAQREAQRGLHPESRDGFLPFAYPPFVVLPYLALRPFGFTGGWLVHVLLMGGLLFMAVRWLAPMLPRAAARPFPLFVLLLAFYPMLRAVLGGQNTALTLALVALTWRLLHDDRPLLAGCAAALLLYKPQFGVPLVGLLLVSRQPFAIAGAAGTAVVLYGAGAIIGGWTWIGWWWSQIARFHTMDQAINAPNSVGILGFLEALLGPGSPGAVIPGVILSALVVGLTLALWWRRRDAASRWGFTAVALVLIPPHSMFYDAGLAGLALAVWIDRRGHAGAAVAAGVWLAALLAPLARVLGVNPLFGVLVALAVLMLRERAGGPGVAGSRARQASAGD
jgi:hypothetical protein